MNIIMKVRFLEFKSKVHLNSNTMFEISVQNHVILLTVFNFRKSDNFIHLLQEWVISPIKRYLPLDINIILE